MASWDCVLPWVTFESLRKTIPKSFSTFSDTSRTLVGIPIHWQGFPSFDWEGYWVMYPNVRYELTLRICRDPMRAWYRSCILVCLWVSFRRWDPLSTVLLTGLQSLMLYLWSIDSMYSVAIFWGFLGECSSLQDARTLKGLDVSFSLILYEFLNSGFSLTPPPRSRKSPSHHPHGCLPHEASCRCIQNCCVTFQRYKLQQFLSFSFEVFMPKTRAALVGIQALFICLLSLVTLIIHQESLHKCCVGFWSCRYASLCPKQRFSYLWSLQGLVGFGSEVILDTGVLCPLKMVGQTFACRLRTTQRDLTFVHADSRVFTSMHSHSWAVFGLHEVRPFYLLQPT